MNIIEIGEMFDAFEKLARNSGESEGRVADRRWHKVKKLHKEHGVMIGGHTRIAVPKRVMNEKDLTHHLGFTKVKIAVPEAGQKRFSSYRHHEHNYHLHDHGDHWTVHKDEHPSATMVLKKMRIAKEKAKEHRAKAKALGKKHYDKAKSKGPGIAHAAKAIVHGIPHVVTEGVPGMYHYAKGKASGAKSTAEKVIGDQGASLNRKFNRWKDSKSKEKNDEHR
jgi:hypothetical protein